MSPHVVPWPCDGASFPVLRAHCTGGEGMGVEKLHSCHGSPCFEQKSEQSPHGAGRGCLRYLSGHSLVTPGGGGGYLGPWPAPAHPHQKKFSSGKKMKITKGAGNLRPILGTQTVCWPPRGWGILPTKQWPGGFHYGDSPPMNHACQLTVSGRLLGALSFGFCTPHPRLVLFCSCCFCCFCCPAAHFGAAPSVVYLSNCLIDEMLLLEEAHCHDKPEIDDSWAADTGEKAGVHEHDADEEEAESCADASEETFAHAGAATDGGAA